MLGLPFTIFFFVAVVTAVKDYHGYKVYEVTPRTKEHLLRLQQYEVDLHGGDFWRQSHGVGDAAYVMVSRAAAPTFVHRVESQGMAVALAHDNVQEILEDEKRRMDEYRNRRDPGLNIDLNRYNRFADISRWLNETASGCGSRCALESIGPSHEGRPLWLMRITSGQTRPIIFLECGIHAREWIAPAVCLHMISKLINDYGSDDTVTRMVDQYDWYIEPVGNPDGYEYTHTDERMWRKTRRVNSDVGSSCVGTDANRNFGHMWGWIGASDDPCDDTYMGSSAFSEPETAAIRDYVSPIRDRIRAYYAVHNCGQYILTPWSYTEEFPPDYDDMESVGVVGADAIFAYDGMTYTVGQSTWLMGPTAGSSDDWAKGDMNIKFSYTIELRDTGFYCFTLPEDQIQDNFNEIFDGWAAMSDDMNTRFPMP